MNKKAIVITTINYPSIAVKKFAKLKDFNLIVAGDNKTPKDWKLTNARYLSISQQQKKFPNFSKLVAINHYARKNLAYLEAMRSGHSFIYETDDDNIPYEHFPQFIEKSTEITSLSSKIPYNVYNQFTHEHIWPRGLPLKSILNSSVVKNNKKINPLIQQSLADLDPDVDAIYRLAIGKLVTFKKDLRLSVAKGTFCPINSQNTYWHKKVFPLLYLPSTVESRVTDIWRGYIAQRILWELDSEVIFSSPSVYQERNVHDYLKDFVDEQALYMQVDKLLAVLSTIKLKGDITAMLLQTYIELVKHSFFNPKELDILKEWLIQITKK